VFNKLKVFKDLAGNQTRSKINAMKCVGGQECNLKKFNAMKIVLEVRNVT
jgi:hypothetical protein